MRRRKIPSFVRSLRPDAQNSMLLHRGAARRIRRPFAPETGLVQFDFQCDQVYSDQRCAPHEIGARSEDG